MHKYLAPFTQVHVPSAKVQKGVFKVLSQRNTGELYFCLEFKVSINVVTQTFAAQVLMPSLKGNWQKPRDRQLRGWNSGNSQF